MHPLHWYVPKIKVVSCHSNHFRIWAKIIYFVTLPDRLTLIQPGRGGEADHAHQLGRYPQLFWTYSPDCSIVSISMLLGTLLCVYRMVMS